MNTNVNHPLNTPNFTEVKVNNLTLWFSYETLIAFRASPCGLVVRENEWSVTTGKHLNYLCDKKERVSRERFYEIAKQYGIEI